MRSLPQSRPEPWVLMVMPRMGSTSSDHATDADAIHADTVARKRRPPNDGKRFDMNDLGGGDWTGAGQNYR